MKLTVKEIEKLECPPGKKDMLVFDDERRGLAVRVMKSAKKGSLDWKSYVAQYTVSGRKRRVPLGAASGISLDAARKATACIRYPSAPSMPASSSPAISASTPAAKRWCGSRSGSAMSTRASTP